ncbi:midnolin-like [Elysia marginata]|uniref:Midnolin-like n=1 Tax=Elysia marginata TaxID=1093978 RepID=A0AAV4HZ46_9GAST|nr:midnolin-like [Elysia marginata]
MKCSWRGMTPDLLMNSTDRPAKTAETYLAMIYLSLARSGYVVAGLGKLDLYAKPPVDKSKTLRNRIGVILLVIATAFDVIPTDSQEGTVQCKAVTEGDRGYHTTEPCHLYTQSCLLFLVSLRSYPVLKDGCIQDHNILDDSQVTLLPNLESGLSINRSDRSIIQALENLTETQVNDFLSGRSPLMLAIRMGENMVFVQLQLSMLHPAPQRNTTNPSASPQVGTPANSMDTAANSRGAPQVQEQQRPHQSPSAVTLNSTSAFAEARRCLSQRLNRLQELNCSGQLASRNLPTTYSGLRPPTEAAAGLDTPPASPAPPTSSSTASARQARQRTHPATTAFPLPPPPVTTEAPHGTDTTSALSSIPVSASAPLSPPPSPGAIIDSMRSLGRGIYSGTFQGTLDPSLQDGQGRPRRSVNTILHILNDLLVAAPSQPQPQPQAAQAADATTRTDSKVPSVQQKPMSVLTPPPSPTARTSAVQTKPRASPPVSSHLSKVSPVAVAAPTNTPASDVEENSDNALLRGKMQRVQMMLAQRKEQRRTRREITGPYYKQNCKAAVNTSIGNMSAESRNQTVTKSIIQSELTTEAPTLPPPMCVAAPMSSSSCSTSSSSAMDESSCMEELQHHQHQQNQKQQKQPSGPSCRNSEHPCQTCAYCNPSREQDSLAV